VAVTSEAVFRNTLDPGASVLKGTGRLDLQDTLDSIVGGLNQRALTEDQLSLAVIEKIRPAPIYGAPRTQGGPYQTNLRYDAAWGPLAGSMALGGAPTAAPAWANGWAALGGADGKESYIELHGTWAGPATISFGFAIPFVVPPNFKRWRGKAIRLRSQIVTVGPTDFAVSAGVVAALPVAPFTSASGTGSSRSLDGTVDANMVESYLTELNMGDGWRPGLVGQVTAFFTMPLSEATTEIKVRWGQLTLDWE